MQHEYNIYDDDDNLIYRYLFNKDTYYDENQTPILLTIDDFTILFKKIKVNLLLHRHNRHEKGNINLEIDDDSINYININYLDKNNLNYIKTNKENITSNLSKIDTNKNDISTSLININTNEDHIAYNSSVINYIKNNICKPYLKNIYNILFYESKAQIDFRGIFFEKVFDIDSKQNDFIEMNFKIDLEYEDISERNYVRTIYELFDETNNSLYVRSVTNDDYTYFSNKVIIDEIIFYNFTKDIKKIKFVIKIQMLLSRVIKIWYIKNDNYRLILKHYST